MAQSGKILITGAAGFVGTALCRQLLEQGCSVRVLVRGGGSRLPEELFRQLDDVVAVEDLTDEVAWAKLLAGVDRVVHLAGRAHGRASSAVDLYFRDNLDLTVALGRAALKAGVERFIFVSTIKVNGEGVLSSDHHPYEASDRPRPLGAYAVSKWRAEQELRALFNRPQGPNLVILRPPMIYGSKAKGNYACLQRWLSWGLPVPVPWSGNRRSLLALSHLLEIIESFLTGTLTEDKLLLPCDPKEWSTERLILDLARQNGSRVRIMRVPEVLFKGLAFISRREAFFIKLFGSLRIAS